MLSLAMILILLGYVILIPTALISVRADNPRIKTIWFLISAALFAAGIILSEMSRT